MGDGFSGAEVRVTPIRTEIIIRATRTREVLGEKGRRIRELTAGVQKRFGFPENSVELFAERVENRGLSAMAQCESPRFKLLGGLVVRRACYGVVRFVMENGAKGCEVTISGKMGQQRAKVMKLGRVLDLHRPAEGPLRRGVLPERAPPPGRHGDQGQDLEAPRPGRQDGPEAPDAGLRRRPRAEGGRCDELEVLGEVLLGFQLLLESENASLSFLS